MIRGLSPRESLGGEEWEVSGELGMEEGDDSKTPIPTPKAPSCLVRDSSLVLTSPSPFLYFLAPPVTPFFSYPQGAPTLGKNVPS